MIIKSHHFNVKNFTSQDIVKTTEGLSTPYGDPITCMDKGLSTLYGDPITCMNKGLSTLYEDLITCMNKGLVYKMDVCRTPREKKE